MNASIAWVRPFTPDDVEWAMRIGKTHYDGLFDEGNVRGWANARLNEPWMCWLRSEHAFGVAHLAYRFQSGTRPQAYLTLLYAEPGNYGRECLRILEALAAWAREKQAGKFWVGDTTNHDLGPVVKLIGGRLAGYTYVVDLDGDAEILG